MPAPSFAHSPMLGRYQMMAYGGGEPLEFFIGAKTARGAKSKADFQAKWSKRQRFAVRNDQGVMLYDGPVLDALGHPIYFRDGSEVYRGRPGYDELAAADVGEREMAA